MTSAAVLAQMPFFAGFSPDDLECLAAEVRPRRYGRGETIFLQGDPGTTLFVVVEGRVKILLTSPEGREFILALLGPGDFFGELALLDGEPRSADAVAQEACRLLLLERDDFHRFLSARPHVVTQLLGLLSRRLRHDTQILQDAAFLDVPARLARTLLELAETQGRPSAAGTVIASKLTQAELAGMVGATRESVNKWLGTYERDGLIGRDQGRIVVRQPAKLRDFAGEAV